MPYSPGFGQNVTQAGLQGAMAGGGRGAAEGVATEALGAVPVVGGMLKGGVSGYRSGLAGRATGLAPGAQEALRQLGQKPRGVEPPKALSKGRKAARGVGIAALNLIPVAGQVLSAGANAANRAYEGRLQKQYAEKVKQTGMGNATRLAQVGTAQKVGRARLAGAGAGPGAPNPRLAGMSAGLGGRPGIGRPGAGAYAGPGGGDVSAGQGNAPGSLRGRSGSSPTTDWGSVLKGVTGVGNAAPAAAPGGGGGSAGAAGIPTGGGVPAGQGNVNVTAARGRGKHKIGGYVDKVFAEQLQRGLDPRILPGLQGAATQAAAGARQNLSDSLARSGDQSGYGQAIGTGVEMSLQNQLAAIPSQYYSQAQDYLNDLIFKFRGTRKGAVSPQPSGQDWGSTLGGIGQAAQGAGALYGALKPAPPAAK